MNTKDKSPKDPDMSKVLPEDPDQEQAASDPLPIVPPQSIPAGPGQETPQEQALQDQDSKEKDPSILNILGPGKQDIAGASSAEEIPLSAPEEEADAEEVCEEITPPDFSSAPDISKQAGIERMSDLQASKLKLIMEALLFSSGQPVSLDRIASVLKDAERKQIKAAMEELVQEYQEREGALEIVEVAGGFQVRTRSEYASWVMKLRQQRVIRLSRAALETLAIVAYRQPVTRAEVESIRGVDTGAVLGNLLERRQVRILGRKEVPGRPIIYGTTKDFLELFGLKSLKDLPTLREIEAMLPAARSEEESTPSEENEKEDKALEAAEKALELDDGEEEEYDALQDEDGLEVEEDEGPIEEISTLELDDILKQTKTKLEHFEEEEAVESTGEASEILETVAVKEKEEQPAAGGAVPADDEVSTENREGESAEDTPKE